MKHYLLLEDGSTFSIEAGQFSTNVLGKLSLDDNKLVMTCCDTGKHINMPLNPIAFEAKLKGSNGLLGKLVSDELPVDYHMYDLKTVII